ncbi:hypothetical protein QR42_10605 [Bacillus sp. WP8]|nr:hypothetical protein QR42_10605 [Bacillus sp. WP8]
MKCHFSQSFRYPAINAANAYFSAFTAIFFYFQLAHFVELFVEKLLFLLQKIIFQIRQPCRLMR